jgi:protein-S-isoprenylcysteine O-methyltransferase Ste14
MWFMLLALCVAMKLGSLADPWPSLLSSFCLAVFYLMLALLIITRSPAKAEADGLLPRIAAFVGTYLPWTITFFGNKTDQALLNLASTVCVLIGSIMMLVTIRHLGRSFSLVPQARSVVQTGPYRWIKHPLYLSEEIAIFGVVLQYLSPLAVLVLILHISVQVCRILYEEDLLRRNCAEYSNYEALRWRLIPYIW